MKKIMFILISLFGLGVSAQNNPYIGKNKEFICNSYVNDSIYVLGNTVSVFDNIHIKNFHFNDGICYSYGIEFKNAKLYKSFRNTYAKNKNVLVFKGTKLIFKTNAIIYESH